MPFAFLPFPYLNSCTLTTQFLILIALGTLSYFYHAVRFALLSFLGIYATYKTAYHPISSATLVATPPMGLRSGVGYIFTGTVAVWNSPDLLKTFLDALDGK
ncbi:hypothetical protein B0H11DRAFT_2251070 [Mycena galericulata]|nr:hypothetical protein B0H11DRAFT_2251070 [Mycena galericulata]